MWVPVGSSTILSRTGSSAAETPSPMMDAEAPQRMLSVRSWRRSAPRLAPRATRIPISFCLAVATTTRKPVRFTTPTSATAPRRATRAHVSVTINAVECLDLVVRTEAILREERRSRSRRAPFRVPPRPQQCQLPLHVPEAQRDSRLLPGRSARRGRWQAPFNSTPFWVFNVESTVIKDHGDIWNISFIELLAQMMAPRGFFDPELPRVQLRKD